MARGVTEQDVFSAADRLLVRGQRPTIERVRLEIGRGSPNTINPLLDAWWSNLSKRQAGAATDSLPAPIRLATEALYQEVLRQAELMAQQSVESLRHEVEADRIAVARASEQVQAEKMGAQALGDALKSELAELRATNDRQMRQISDLAGQLEIERREAAEARLKARLADEERTRITEAASAELSRVREQWNANERHWLKEIETLRDELKRTRQDAGGAQLVYRRQVEALERDASNRAAELQALRAQILIANELLREERQLKAQVETAANDALRKLKSAPADRWRKRLRRVR